MVQEVKQKINIYSTPKIFTFISQFFKNYELIFNSIDQIHNKKNNNDDLSIIFYKKDLSRVKKINLEYINNNNIIISDSISDNNKEKYKFLYLKAPIKADFLKSEVIKYISNKENSFEDISITDKLMVNNENNLSCFLTEIENDILIHLVKYKKCKKDDIKKNILKINKNIETNSLESHLTRIRKKLEKIKTKVKIISRNDILLILVS